MARPEPAALEPLLQRGYRYALSLTHDSGRAEDLLHDAVLRVLKKGEVENLGYLIATIRNRFIDLHRRERLVVMQPLDDIGEEALSALDAPDMTLDPERLEQALDTLRPPEREALYLAGVESYTAQEIADLTGRPRGTVLSLIHRARGKVRRFLAPKIEEAQG
jgi:RNA polymerase sigma-70 factor (ECF subfamily)